MKYSAQSNTVIKHEVEDGPDSFVCACTHTHTHLHVLHLYMGVYKMETLPHIP